MYSKNLIRDIAKDVERIVRKNLSDKHAGRMVAMGADGTPTKMIDKVAEDCILSAVKKNNIDINILSEEAGFIDNGADKMLVLDPVDGTQNAIRGIPFYSVSIAVGARALSDVEYGIVRSITTGDVYEAERGKGAFLNGKRLRSRDYAKNLLADKKAAEKRHGVKLSAKPDRMYSVFLGERSTDTCRQLAARPRRARSLGCASLEMCLVATGALDLYYQDGQILRVTDIAASTLILREAGGEAFDMHKKVLELGLSLSERSGVIAVADKRLIKEI